MTLTFAPDLGFFFNALLLLDEPNSLVTGVRIFSFHC